MRLSSLRHLFRKPGSFFFWVKNTQGSCFTDKGRMEITRDSESFVFSQEHNCGRSIVFWAQAFLAGEKTIPSIMLFATFWQWKDWKSYYPNLNRSSAECSHADTNCNSLAQCLVFFLANTTSRVHVNTWTSTHALKVTSGDKTESSFIAVLLCPRFMQSLLIQHTTDNTVFYFNKHTVNALRMSNTQESNKT